MPGVGKLLSAGSYWLLRQWTFQVNSEFFKAESCTRNCMFNVMPVGILRISCWIMHILKNVFLGVLKVIPWGTVRLPPFGYFPDVFVRAWSCQQLCAKVPWLRMVAAIPKCLHSRFSAAVFLNLAIPSMPTIGQWCSVTVGNNGQWACVGGCWCLMMIEMLVQADYCWLSILNSCCHHQLFPLSNHHRCGEQSNCLGVFFHVSLWKWWFSTSIC